MKFYEPLVLLLGFLAQILGTRITLDDEAQALCKKYKMVCKTGKVCAVQHFDVPKHITIPVCIPLSFVPVRNLICQLPPDPGRCFARYIRWYYNIHSRECSHFRYGGCHGNQNNFMSKSDCQKSCLATPSIKLFEGGQSALVQMKPSIMTAPVYEQPSQTNSFEALNSVVYSGPDAKYDRYRVARHRSNKNQPDEANTRKRRRLDREKERRRRERRKEKKRLKRLRQRQRNLKKGKKGKKGKKNKKKKAAKKAAAAAAEKEKEKEKLESEMIPEAGNDVAVKEIATETDVAAAETKAVASNEIEPAKDSVDEDSEDAAAEEKRKRKRKKRRNKDRKKRDRYRTRRHRPSYRRYGELRAGPHGYFSILDQDEVEITEKENSPAESLS